MPALLLALFFSVLMGFGALVTDTGILFANHLHLQYALNSAALAGVSALPADTAEAESLAAQYAASNGAPNLQVAFAVNNQEIIVSASKIEPTFFAQVLGIKQVPLSATAKAIRIPPVRVSGIVPLAVSEQNFMFGQTYLLKLGGGSGDNGWYRPVRLSGPGANDYNNDLAYGFNGTISIGDTLTPQTGNMSGPTEQAISYRMQTGNTLVFLPIVDDQMMVLGFAAFQLQEVMGNGNDSVVTGTFVVDTLNSGLERDDLADLISQENNVSGGQTSFGLYVSKLLPE